MKKVLVAIGAISIFYAICRSGREQPAASVVRDSLVTDRLWVDHLPQSERDICHVFVALTDAPIGVFQSTSTWKGEYELFRYEMHTDELRIVFPHTGDRESVKAKATQCDEEGMDYCLELQGSSRGVNKYYSLKGWEIDRLDDVAPLKAKLRVVKLRSGPLRLWLR